MPPAAGAVAAAAVPGAMSIIQGLLAPGANSGTREGASNFLSQMGQGTSAVGDVMNALRSQEKRDMSGAATSAAGQAGSLGVANPYAWIEHAKGQVANQYANSKLNAGLAQRQQDIQARLQAISMGGR